MTCDGLGEPRQAAPTSIAAAPPMPASTSSNTNVGTGSAAAITTSIASMTRLSSPPDALLATGRGSAPVCGASSIATSSRPLADSAPGVDRDDDSRVGHRERVQLRR